jgi:alkanesulfonate monooxygenase SsuD/methylene tetrahydromethanopterin reductase-like flavin-dependent oxidoreductase (luciferase family)
MKIGILGFITETSTDTVTFGRKAESLGFDTFFMPEHPIIPVVRKSAYPASTDGVMPEARTLYRPCHGLAQAAAGTTHG